MRRTRCPQCKGKLEPGQRIHPDCIQAYADAQAAKSARKQAKAAKLQAKVERESIPDLLKEAQTAFNAYIRERDRGQPCICCGQPLGAGSVGGYYDAGHYRSVGSASHLRFDPDNCHAQRKQCNRYGAGRAVDYQNVQKAPSFMAGMDSTDAEGILKRQYIH